MDVSGFCFQEQVNIIDKFLSNWAQDNYENFKTGTANRKRTQSYSVKLLLSFKKTSTTYKPAHCVECWWSYFLFYVQQNINSV